MHEHAVARGVAMIAHENANWKAIDYLNVLLYDELLAAEAERQALSVIPESPTRAGLVSCIQSHEARAKLLRDEIARLGGIPLWRSMSDFLEPLEEATDAAAAAIANLASEETTRWQEYQAGARSVDSQTRHFVKQLILPEQARTCECMHALRQRVTFRGNR